jgi:hypothetical protein
VSPARDGGRGLTLLFAARCKKAWSWWVGWSSYISRGIVFPVDRKQGKEQKEPTEMTLSANFSCREGKMRFFGSGEIATTLASFGSSSTSF